MTMTSAALKERAQNGSVPDDNQAPKPKRRRFSPDYKLSILEEYERISEEGGKGALLRREGLYSSHIVEWQRAREVGALAGLAPTHRKKRSVECRSRHLGATCASGMQNKRRGESAWTARTSRGSAPW
jgi:transposase-like protein